MNRKTGKKIRKLHIGTLLAVILFLCLACAGCGKQAEEADAGPSEEVAGEGVWINNHDVSGMTLDQINEIITEDFSEKSAQTISLNANGMTIQVYASDLGLYCKNPEVAEQALEFGKRGSVVQEYRCDNYVSKNGSYIFNIQYAVSEDTVKALLQQRASALNAGMTGSSLVHNSDGTFTVNEGESGLVVDQDAAVDRIMDYMENEWTGGVGSVTLSVTEGDNSAEVEELSLVKDVLGSFSTQYDATEEERSQNIEVGTAKIDGTLLYPGQSLSVCSVLEPFTEEEGYAAAHSYEMGAVIDSLGGGVCQISTTLYNAVLRAELEVTQRSAHSMVVSYIDPSLDAAIAEGGSKDLVFVNNTDAPVYIEGTAGGGTVSFTIYGHETRDPGRTVQYQSEILETTDYTYEYVMDDTEDVGSYEIDDARIGYKARAWKIVYQDGVEQSREIISTSEYQMKPATYTIGIKGATSAEIQSLETAIASDDFDTVFAELGVLTYNHPGALFSTKKTEADNTEENTDSSDGSSTDSADAVQ